MTELLKIVEWPAVLAGCFIFACVFFRRQVADLINRTTSVGKEGLRTSPPAGQMVQDVDKAKKAQELVQALTSPIIREREEQIRKELKEKGLEDNSEMATVLVRYLATTLILITFEEFYRVIFGSQIFLLRTANENRAAGLSEKFVQDHFSQVKQHFVPVFDQWGVDDYVHYPLATGLLLRNGDSYQITNLGVDFLQWITKIGAPEEKGL